MEAGVRVGDVYALLIGEQCCPLSFILVSLDNCERAEALLCVCSYTYHPTCVCQNVPTAEQRICQVFVASSSLADFAESGYGVACVVCLLNQSLRVEKGV